ncbi:metallophosphoesterase, partial [Hydrogenophaga sp. OTU3427]|uniref:metallophosphoesterase n=1 Tax=Hydrogenophaga sp. OTU3427 TaxID=3043856 RepID=UPI00313BF1CE
ELRAAARGTSVTFLERDVVDYGGVRFLGCTLWTDYRLQCNRTQRQLMEHAQLRINDHRLISTSDGSFFTVARALEEHKASRAWLESELLKDYDGKTVVITHHAPHSLSVHPRYAGDATNAAFASDLTDLLQRADYWLHGHVHDSFDYTVVGCRVVANPRGYARNISAVEHARQLQFENRLFSYACIVDISGE